MRGSKALLLAVLLAFSMFMFLTDFFPVVSATYMEGVITHDTV